MVGIFIDVVTGADIGWGFSEQLCRDCVGTAVGMVGVFVGVGVGVCVALREVGEFVRGRV